jgi:hypothetical protein
MRQNWGRCSTCQGDFMGHEGYVLASVILDAGNHRSGELADLISAHEWERAVKYQEWKGDRDERMYYVVRCPNDPRLTLVTRLSVWELWLDDKTEWVEILDDESARVVARLAGDRWKLFPF